MRAVVIVVYAILVRHRDPHADGNVIGGVPKDAHDVEHDVLRHV